MDKVLNRRIDLILVFVILGITAGISVGFNLRPLLTAILYLGLPTIYLVIREKKNWPKIFWGIVFLGIIVGFVFDFVVTFNRGWIVTVTHLVFPWKILNILPLDELIGWALMTLFIIVFYEHFLDDERNTRISKNLKWALIPFTSALMFLLIIYFINPTFLYVSYTYLLGGIVAIIFPLALSLYKTRFLAKFLKLGAFFFIAFFVLELVCLKNGDWTFPAEYISVVKFFGFTFPFEELFFWMMFYAATVVSYYEFFIDDAA